MMNDVVMQMLRFGKEHLQTGFKQSELANYLTGQGHEPAQVNQVISLYFNEYFSFQGNQTAQTHYYLNPKGYFDLLQIDNTLESRNQAKNATILAIASIMISGVLALASIVLSIYTTPTVNLNKNEQLGSLIQQQQDAKKNLEQLHQDILKLQAKK